MPTHHQGASRPARLRKLACPPSGRMPQEAAEDGEQEEQLPPRAASGCWPPAVQFAETAACSPQPSAPPLGDPRRYRGRVGPGLAAQHRGLTCERLASLALGCAPEYPGDLGRRSPRPSRSAAAGHLGRRELVVTSHDGAPRRTARRRTAGVLRALIDHPLRRSGLCKSGSPSERRSFSSVVPARSWHRLSRSATATRMSVFVVIRSPAPPRFLFRTRARMDRLVIWSGQISSSFRSRRRYFGRPGPAPGAGLAGPLAAPAAASAGPSARPPPESVLPHCVPAGIRTSGLCCTGVCTSAGGEADGRAGIDGTSAETGSASAEAGASRAHAGVLSARRPSSMSSSTWTRRTSSTAARHERSPR